MFANWIHAALALFIALALLSLYRRREVLGGKLRQAFIMLCVFVLTVYIAQQLGADVIRAALIAALVEVIIGLRVRPRRSRYIPRRERRKVIARYEARTGQRYDPKRHHIDHIIPHARGGGNRADNLRVLERERNLAKSDRAPWWDVFSR